MMKKRFVMLLTACLTLTMFVGCGDKDGNPTMQDYNVEKIVTLGEYKGLEVSVAAPAVDEASVQMYVENIFQNNITEEIGVKDRAVENGDLTYISYVGTQDGVAFDGGTSEGTFLEIGSGSYIEGFEEGLVGVMPGETVDLNLTFPENYHNTDLAGKEVVFTVTVIYIAPEMNDDVIAAMGVEDFSNVDELNQFVYDQLLIQAESNYEISIENEIIEQIMENTTFDKIPEELVAKYTENAAKNMEAAAAQFGYDVETYVMSLYGTDATTLTKQFGENYAKQGLIFQAIANTENLNVSDEELETGLQEEATLYGASSVEEMLGDTDKEDYRDFYMFEKVIAFLVENTTVVTE